MKKEILEQELNGLEINEDAFNKIYALINKQENLSKQSLETEKNSLNADLETLKTRNANYEKTIDALRAKATENEEIEKELNELKKSIKESEKRDLEKRRESQIESVIEDVIGSKKFVNEYTKKALIDGIKTELNNPDNFKGVGEIFNDLTKDKEGIFAEEHEKPNMPTMAKVDDSTRPTKEEFKKMKYSERVEIYENDPDWYNYLTDKN